MPDKVKVLIVDDSAYMRVVLKDILESDPDIVIIGSAKDGVEAIEKARTLSPHVVLLDIQMPRMDGLATLRRIMRDNPTRVVMLSAMDKFDDQLPIQALEFGAVDFISKPSGPVSIDIVNFKDKIVGIVKLAAGVKVDVLKRATAPLPHRLNAIRKVAAPEMKGIVLAASTGGPRALETIFAALPKGLPAPLFIIQHIPAEFSNSLTKRLSSKNGPRVVVAGDEQRAEKGTAYLAPGGRHLKLAWKGASSLVMRLSDESPVNFVKPSADVLFKSAADCLRANAMGIVLTGMGADGAAGAKAIRHAGGEVLVQDEQSSLAFSMPRSVIEAGAASKILPLESIAERIVRFLEE
jgi:two-component system chemotaxis response regulator CheB